MRRQPARANVFDRMTVGNLYPRLYTREPFTSRRAACAFTGVRAYLYNVAELRLRNDGNVVELR